MFKKTKLSNTDQQVQLVVQGLVDHLIQSRDGADEIHITGAAGEYGVQVDITETDIQILVAHSITYELYAWTSYLKESRTLGIHHRHSLLSKYLNDLILLERMDVI